MNDPRPLTSDSGAEHLAAAARFLPDQELAALRERVQLAIPDIVLGECLGRGGMGAVYRARQLKLDRDVAVKVLLPPPGDVRGWIERFRREAQALARLDHPGIVRVHDFGQGHDHAWIVMELVDGTNLREMLAEGRLAPEEALAIVPSICSALQYAHDRGVIHRDVKPENVLFDRSGNVKLVDFGLAKLSGADADLQLTRTDQAMGTPRYMAPEQLERPRDVDHRADIFSLGVVFYEMLTGQVPAGVVEPPSQRTGVDERLDDVVFRALEREPDRRYQQAAEMEDRLDEVSSGADLHVAAPVGASPAATASVATGPLRIKEAWTVADAMALVAWPVVMFVIAVSQMGDRTPFRGMNWNGVLTPIVLVSMLWWVIPIATSVHTIAGLVRKRAVPFSMPAFRAGWAVFMAAVTFILTDHLLSNRDGSMPEGAPRVVRAFGSVSLLIGASIALFGASSPRGAHRRLLGPTMVQALTGLAATMAACSPLIVLFVVSNGAVRGGVSPTGQMFAAQLPIIAAGTIAAVFLRSGELRKTALAVALGAAGTLLANVLTPVMYGEMSHAAMSVLALSFTASIAAAAGSLAPGSAAREHVS